MLHIGILGGTRFIGYHLVEALLTHGMRVTLFHRGRTHEPRKFSAPVQRIIGDRNKPSSLEPFFSQNFDAVIDLSGFQPHQVQPVLQRWWKKIGHFLFCSTTSVYQVPPPKMFDEETPSIKGLGSYGGDKTAIEEMLLTRTEKDHWPVTIFRPQGVIGPYGASQALYAMRRLLSERPVHLRPGTEGIRVNFLSVTDLVRCFVEALHNPKAYGQVFNVCNDETITPNEFVNLLGQVNGIKLIPPVVISEQIGREFPDMGLSWPLFDLVPNNHRIKNHLGMNFEPIRGTFDCIRRWIQAEPSFLRLNSIRWEDAVLRGDRLQFWLRKSRSVLRRQPWLRRSLSSIRRVKGMIYAH